MLICLMCDLHLPYNKNAVQYDVFDWACSDLQKKKADAVIVAGDFTADGNVFAAKRFVRKIHSLGVPSVVVVGNSDCRTEKNIPFIQNIASPIVTRVGEFKIISACDCDGNLSDDVMENLERVDFNTVVAMHHPPESMTADGRQRFEAWRASHPETKVFCGHLHKSKIDGNTVCLQTADPDKATGENPCITYYDTDSGKLTKAYYFCPVPTDFPKYFGISCYRLCDIDIAARHGLKCIELRRGVIDEPIDNVKNRLELWRKAGGEKLSVHAPNVTYENGRAGNSVEWDSFIEFAVAVKADRVTVHVPKVPVDVVKKDADVLDSLADFIAKRIALLPENCIVGVENMHMADGETENERSFGYLPEECAEFMKHLSSKCMRKVGINLDIGHARNNSPFSTKYTLGVWYAELGRYTVGYHLHKVVSDGTSLCNHLPFIQLYDGLASPASLFSCWNRGEINKAPVILEIRNSEYEQTLRMFEREFRRSPFDLHSHTLFSNCGRDKPELLISTAIANGIKLLGISDHNYGIADRKAKYLAKMRDLQSKYADKIKLLCGIEIATLPELYDLHDVSEIADYDYCLLEHIPEDVSVCGKNLIDFCRSLGIRCGIAHTDMFAYCKMCGYDPSEFFKKLADNGIFWEMNVSYDSIHFYREHSYVADFMNDEEKQKIVRNAGLHVSVGFDSHRCEDYDGYRVHRMYDFLKEKNIKTADLLFV